MKNLQEISQSRTRPQSPVKVRSNSMSKSINKPLSKQETPHIDLFNIRELKIIDTDSVMKNFSQMMKQIIDTKNTNFLNGEINLIEYILSKYTNIPIEKVVEIEKLSLKVNYEYCLLNQFGIYLPKLKQLRLNNSIIPSISEVGSSFLNLQELYISDTGLKDLNGIICFQKLEILDASENLIEELHELEMCTSLVKLNLKNNKISKVGDLDYLSMLFDLKWLNLVGNPIHDLENYKYIIKENLPDLEVLDKDEELCNMTVNVSLAAEESESENRNTNEMKTVVDFNKNINFDDNSKHNSTFNTSTYSQKLRPPSSNMSANQNILDNENANLSKTSSNFGLKNPKYLLEADTAIQGLKSMITNKRNLNPIIKKDLRQSVDKLQSNVADPFDDEVSPIMKKELVKILNDGQKRTQNYIEFKNKTYVKKEENEVKRDLKPMPIKLIRRDSSLKKLDKPDNIKILPKLNNNTGVGTGLRYSIDVESLMKK